MLSRLGKRGVLFSCLSIKFGMVLLEIGVERTSSFEAAFSIVVKKKRYGVVRPQEVVDDEMFVVGANVGGHIGLVAIIEFDRPFHYFVVVVVSIDKRRTADALLRVAHGIVVQFSRQEHDSFNPGEHHHLILHIGIENMLLNF